MQPKAGGGGTPNSGGRLAFAPGDPPHIELRLVPVAKPTAEERWAVPHHLIDVAEPESGDPTTGCAACDSLRVAVLRRDSDDTLLLCANCRAVLKMQIEEFVAGSFGT